MRGPTPMCPKRIALSMALLMVAREASADRAEEVSGALPGRPVSLERFPKLPHVQCSARLPFCVHVDSAPPPLSELEETFERVRAEVGPPEAGTAGLFRIALLPSRDPLLAGAPARTHPTERIPWGGYESYATFLALAADVDPDCTRVHFFARELVRAALWRVSPGVDPGTGLAHATAVARIVAPCEGVTENERAAFRSQPERTLSDPRDEPFASGGAAFYEWLSSRRGNDVISLVRGLWALAPTRRGEAAPRFLAGTPDTFEVLRTTLGKSSSKAAAGPGSGLEAALVDFAIFRAGEGPAPRLSFDLPFPEKPRRYVSEIPISPTGVAYIAIARPADRGDLLRVEIEWEHYARMRWVVLKFGPSGEHVGTIPIVSEDRGNEARMTLMGLGNVSRLLLVGVSLGDPRFPFDPDDGAWEPHGYMVTLLP